MTLCRATEPPVAPSAEDAHRWLEDELARPEYHRAESLLDRFFNWLSDQFENTEVLGIPQGAAVLLVAVGTVILAVIVFTFAGPVGSRARTATRAVLDIDDERTADQLRAAATDAAAAGKWNLATMDRFRAVVRAVEERAILDPRPGRTAQEFASAASARFDGVMKDLVAGANSFDDVCYGNRQSSASTYQRMCELDDRLAGLRPIPATSSIPQAVA